MKNIIFDWSGTLFNNVDAMYEAVRRVFEDEGREFTREDLRNKFRQPLPQFYAEYFPQIPYDRIKSRVMKYYVSAESPTIFSGIQDELKKLKDLGKMLAIFTSHPGKTLEHELQHNSMSKYFDDVVADVRIKKEEMAIFLKDHGFKKEETCYVGDMIDDIEAAKSIGVASVAVGWGYHSAERLRAALPDTVLTHVGDMSRVLTE